MRHGGVAFRVGPLDGAWQRARVDSERVAFHHPDGGTISASVDCRSADAPLSILTNHLLLGLDKRQILREEPLQLDGRAALRSRVAGQVEGVPVVMDLVVVQKARCVYDLQLVGSDATVDRHAAAFARFFGGFATSRP